MRPVQGGAGCVKAAPATHAPIFLLLSPEEAWRGVWLAGWRGRKPRATAYPGNSGYVGQVPRTKIAVALTAAVLLSIVGCTAGGSSSSASATSAPSAATSAPSAATSASATATPPSPDTAAAGAATPAASMTPLPAAAGQLT